MTWALWNGELMPLADVRVSVLDRGFLFGDGVYEVVRVYDGNPWLLDLHMARLQQSLDGLMIAASAAALAPGIARLLAHSKAREASIYIQITRGTAPRTHVPPAGMTPNQLVWVQELEADYGAQKRERGIAVTLSPDLRWGRCELKTVNLLGNVLGGMQAKSQGFDEALLFDPRSGYVTEGTHSTAFFVSGGTLKTTPLGANVLPSITRAHVLTIARALAIPVREENIPASAVAGMDEAFFCGTLSELHPVVRIGNTVLSGGEPGPVTGRLLGAYMDQVRNR